MNAVPFSFFPTIISIVITIIYLLVLGVSVYALVLFIKLANRGIKALDIYINEKSNKSL